MALRSTVTLCSHQKFHVNGYDLSFFFSATDHLFNSKTIHRVARRSATKSRSSRTFFVSLLLSKINFLKFHLVYFKKMFCFSFVHCSHCFYVTTWLAVCHTLIEHDFGVTLVDLSHSLSSQKHKNTSFHYNQNTKIKVKEQNKNCNSN